MDRKILCVHRRFDEGSDLFNRYNDNEYFIAANINHIVDQIEAVGYMTLNDMISAFGFDDFSEEGLRFGYVKETFKPKYIKFTKGTDNTIDITFTNLCENIGHYLPQEKEVYAIEEEYR